MGLGLRHSTLNIIDCGPYQGPRSSFHDTHMLTHLLTHVLSLSLPTRPPRGNCLRNHVYTARPPRGHSTSRPRPHDVLSHPGPYLICIPSCYSTRPGLLGPWSSCPLPCFNRRHPVPPPAAAAVSTTIHPVRSTGFTSLTISNQLRDSLTHCPLPLPTA